MGNQPLALCGSRTVVFETGSKRSNPYATRPLNVTESLYSNVDRKNVNISRFLDLRKAFDTIAHDILLAKFEKYGICKKELAWFASQPHRTTAVLLP